MTPPSQISVALLLGLGLASLAIGHDANGRSIAPAQARRVKNPLESSTAELAAGKQLFALHCASCHGLNGKLRSKNATNLAQPMMEAMRDGEIHWVITNGVSGRMPAFAAHLSDTQSWQLTLHVRQLRLQQKQLELAKLGPYKWDLPPQFPFPNVPPDNLITAEKIELGRYLFYDKRLSANQTQSCGSCHEQARSFTDGRPLGIGSTGEKHPRSSMSLLNVAYNSVLTWANPNLRSLEDQALVPLFGEHPVELGLSGKEDLLVARLKADGIYQNLFKMAFPGEPNAFSIKNITRAIASFERTIISGNSPYDRYKRGNVKAITSAAKRGETLFFSEKLECFHCHGGFNFTGSIDYFDKGIAEVEFHNNGLLAEPQPKLGLYEFTRRPEDIARFKAPSLRNIAVTAPYMHDGSILTLDAVISHYASGGRRNSNQSEFVKPITLTKRERADLLTFLNSLTDQTILRDPRLADPFAPRPQTAGLAPDSIEGDIVAIYPDDPSIIVDCDLVPSSMDMLPGHRMEFEVASKQILKGFKPGQRITGIIHKVGEGYLVENIRRLQR